MNMKNRKPVRLILTILLIAVVVAQFVPVTRDNPAVRADFDGDASVKAVLKKSCYDCHSNETAWPWYSYVAPVSWLVASDVTEAREKLNFSEWGLLTSENQAHARREVWKEVEKGEMPLGKYLLMHSDAVPTDEDKAVIQDWAKGAGQAVEPTEEAGD
jgi:uncharacterized membrane protein